MSEANEYENFADEHIDLAKAMEDEITCIVDQVNIYDRDPREQAKKIMRLVLATKYEW